MASVTDKLIATSSTSVMTAAESRAMGSPIYVKNESPVVLALVVSGSDAYDLDPGEPYQILPGQVVTCTAPVADSLLQIIVGIAPANESASKGGGSASVAGSAAVGDGRGKWSVAQNDFTAVYLGPDTLTLGTFPAAMGTPVSGDFAMVVVTDAAGVQRAHFPTANAMTLAGQVLTVAGAAFVTGGSADKGYDVIAWGPPRGYDASTNADQVYPLTQPRPQQDSPQQSATGLGDGTTHKYFDVEQGQLVTFRILDTPGVAGDNTYTLHESVLNDGTAEGSADYQDVTMDEVGQAQVTGAEIAATPSIGRWKIVAFQAKRYCITCVRANDGANTDGAYQYDAMWS